MPVPTAVPSPVNSIPVFKLYGEQAPWPTPDMLHCETIAARSTLHNWEIRPHQHHGLFQLLYLKAGQARVRADEDELDMRPGQVLLVPQMCIHGFNFAPHTEGHVLTLAYPLLSRGGAAGETLLGLQKPYLHQLPPGDEGDDLRLHFSTIDREYRQAGAHRELLLEALLASMLAWLARQIVPSALSPLLPGGAARGPHHFGRFCQMIEAEYCTQHAVSWYADRIGISPAHLNALCRQASRQSALELIHQRLLLEARRRLAYSTRTVSAVSYELGFADPAYFTRFFKQRAGLSPKAFRARALATFSASNADA